VVSAAAGVGFEGFEGKGVGSVVFGEAFGYFGGSKWEEKCVKKLHPKSCFSGR